MISFVVVLIGVLLAVSSGFLSTIDATGIVDEDIERLRFLAGLVGAVVAGIGTKGLLKTWPDKFGPTLQVVLAVVVGLGTAALALWFFFGQPDQEYLQGEISDDTPFARRTLLTGGNGSRYFVTLDTTPGLTATFSIRGAGQEISGVSSDGRIVADGVLAGDATWTVVIKSLEGSGKYLLYVDSVEPTELALSEDAHPHNFDPGRARSSFIFTVEGASGETADLHVKARAVIDDEPNPGWTLRTSRGITIDHKLIEDESKSFTIDQSTRTEVPPGRYVLDVFGAVGQRFELTVSEGTQTSIPTPGMDPPTPGATAPGSTTPGSTAGPRPSPEPSPAPTPNPTPNPTPVPEPGHVALPTAVQYRAPGSVVAAALAEAGFVVQTVPVCSNSFADAELPVGTTRQVVKAGAATISDEVEIVGANGPNTSNLGQGNTLPRSTSLEVKTFNGLPCN